MVTLRTGRCLGQAAVLRHSGGDSKQVGELQTICLIGGLSYVALSWNTAFWKDKISHAD